MQDIQQWNFPSFLDVSIGSMVMVAKPTPIRTVQMSFYISRRVARIAYILRGPKITPVNAYEDFTLSPPSPSGNKVA